MIFFGMGKHRPIKLKSKTIRRALYLPEREQLVVWLPSMGKRSYYGVSRNVFDKLIEAEDPDFYYSTYIRDGYETGPRKSALVKWAVLIALCALLTLPIWMDLVH
jgi:hypothetical protein